MKYQTWSSRKFWAVIVGVFILGFVMAPKPEVVIKEVEKRVEVAKEVPADLTNWKALKETDDQVISYCADFAGLSSQGFEAASRFDVDGMQSVNVEISALTKKVTDLAQTRLSILSKLGY